MADLGTMRVKVGADISELRREMDAGKKSVRDFSTETQTSAAKAVTSLSSLDDIFASVTDKLNKRIDSNVFSALDANAAKLEKQLSDLEQEALGASNSFTKLGTNVNPLSKELAETAIKANKLDSSLAKGKGANEAAFALTNLGRVAQDLPYGFIGIQNNLNPLLESFQRLKAETGSTGSAMKALLKGLAGGGGVGLAVSAVTAAISFATIGFDMWTRGMHKSSNELDENAKKAKEAADSYKSIVSSVAEEAIKVEILITQLKKETLTRQQRTAAIKELQRISPEYFANLNAEKATINEITAAYENYAAAIIKSINYKLGQKDIEDVQKKILDLQKKQVDFTSDTVDEDGKLIKSKKALYDTEAKGESEYQRFAHGRGMLTEAENTQLKNLIKTRDEMLEQLAKIAPKPTTTISTKGTKESEKNVETISDVLKKLAIQIDFLNQKELLLKTDQSQAKINAIESSINELMQKFGLKANNPIVLKLEAQVQDINLKEIFKKDTANRKNEKLQVPVEFKPELKPDYQAFDTERYKLIQRLKELGVKKIKSGGVSVPVDTANLTELNKGLDDTQKRLENVANLTTQTLSPAFDALFEGILSGSQNAFQSFGDALRQTIIQLGAAVLKAALFAAILNAITPGATFGGSFKKLMGFSDGGPVKGFSSGGFIDGPGTKTSDSILARLSRGEFVIKADTVSKFGVGFFEKLNRGLMPKFDSFGFAKFATGGFVSPNIIRTSQVPSMSGIAIGGGQAIQITGDFQLRNDRLVAAVSRGNAQIRRNS